jgi:FkbM family methyltransferase
MNEKLKLIERVRATNFLDEIMLLFYMMRYTLLGGNFPLKMVVEVDGVRYRLVDLESLFISPRYEAHVMSYIKPVAGDVFVDIGAHVGKYSLQIAKIVGDRGKVIAIEPDPENFKALVEGIRMNKLSNVVAFNVAAWDKECRLPLYISPPKGKTHLGYLIGKGGSSLKRAVNRSITWVYAIPLDRIIEDLRISKVSYIKIDVEGAEYEVLKGSSLTIEKS